VTREERLLLAAVRDAEARLAHAGDGEAVCRHGWPLPVERTSRRFVAADGIERWAQVYVTNRSARCPDEQVS
jgi:hypothetical protein